MKSLQQLFDEHEGRLVDKWAHYLPIYERYFAKFRGTACRVLEIGVAHGGSLQLWKAYFGPEAHIMGLDINLECLTYMEPQILIFWGDQADEIDLIASFEHLDIIIDDGSHQLSDQQASLDALWPKLNDGGVYLIEDLHEGRYPIVKEDAYSLNYYPWVMVMEKGSQEMIRIVKGKPSRPLNNDEQLAYGAIDAQYLHTHL